MGLGPRWSPWAALPFSPRSRKGGGGGWGLGGLKAIGWILFAGVSFRLLCSFSSSSSLSPDIKEGRSGGKDDNGKE
uniref:Uncharacterized protein n=1 Tax=Aegilops tauschii TaxID=37682 RepID=M8CUT9_AEGTA